MWRTTVLSKWLPLAVMTLFNCQPLWAADSCADVFSSQNGNLQPNISAFDRAGGLVIRLPKVSRDGFGDIMNAKGIASEIQQSWPNTKIKIVVDDQKYYSDFGRIFPKFKSDLPANQIDSNTDIVNGESDFGKSVVEKTSVQVQRFAQSVPLTFGNAHINFYVEEPGVPANMMKALDEIPRGKKLVDEFGNHHIRVNPGFRKSEFGVNLPDVRHLEPLLAKSDLIQALRDEKSFVLPNEVADSNTVWGLAYHHRQRGAVGTDYYEGLFQSLTSRKVQSPVYIFDFSDRPRTYEKLKTFLDKTLSGRLLQFIYPRFNHVYPNGKVLRGWLKGGKQSPYTIVHVGLSQHRLFQQFLRRAEMPVLVTGTQSLFEAIALEIPFYYDMLNWKQGLADGMIEHAKEHFPPPFADFIAGMMNRSYDTRVQYLVVLMNDKPLQNQFREFLKSLKKTPSLAENLNQLTEEILDYENH